jgi:hypothetical protein
MRVNENHFFYLHYGLGAKTKTLSAAFHSIAIRRMSSLLFFTRIIPSENQKVKLKNQKEKLHQQNNLANPPQTFSLEPSSPLTLRL